MNNQGKITRCETQKTFDNRLVLQRALYRSKFIDADEDPNLICGNSNYFQHHFSYSYSENSRSRIITFRDQQNLLNSCTYEELNESGNVTKSTIYGGGNYYHCGAPEDSPRWSSHTYDDRGFHEETTNNSLNRTNSKIRSSWSEEKKEFSRLESRQAGADQIWFTEDDQYTEYSNLKIDDSGRPIEQYRHLPELTYTDINTIKSKDSLYSITVWNYNQDQLISTETHIGPGADMDWNTLGDSKLKEISYFANPNDLDTKFSFDKAELFFDRNIVELTDSEYQKVPINISGMNKPPSFKISRLNEDYFDARIIEDNNNYFLEILAKANSFEPQVIISKAITISLCKDEDCQQIAPGQDRYFTVGIKFKTEAVQ